jgi:histidinol-phosphate aminotransferase
MPVPPISRRRFTGSLAASLSGLSALAAGARRAAAADAPPAIGAPLIRLNSNESPYGPSEKALAAMRQSEPLAGRYPYASMGEVAAAIAEAHGVAADRIVLGCGSSEVLRVAGAAFLGPGKTLVVAEPTFEAVLDFARVTAAEAVKVPLTGDFRHDLPRMAAACDARTGLVYVCNPNNPTGTIVTGDEFEAFLARAPRSATVLVDEAYHELVEDPRHRTALGLLDRFPNLVVARTFSKVHGMAGMRLGYGVASAGAAQAMRERSSWANVNVAVALAGVASLRDRGHAERTRDRLNATRRLLCAELEKEGRRTIPSHANFVMIHVGRDVGPVVDAFRERGILVGRRFAALPDWLRVSVGTPEETAAFLAALRAIVPAPPAAA